MEYELDQGAGAGRRLGLIVLSIDETLEYEARGILAGRGVNLLHTRIPAQADVTPEDLQAMAPQMTCTAALLPQGLSALGYGCTSASAVIGPAEVARRMQVAQPGECGHRRASGAWGDARRHGDALCGRGERPDATCARRARNHRGERGEFRSEGGLDGGANRREFDPGRDDAGGACGGCSGGLYKLHQSAHLRDH